MEQQQHDVGRWRVHSRTLTIDSSRDAPWVVLVHGLGVSGRYMTPLACLLAPRFRVAVPDLPGHGRTRRRGPVLDVREQADVLRRWVEAAGIRRPHVLANSFGCQIVVELAARPDADLRSLVLVGPTMDPAAATARRQAVRLVRGALHEPLSVVGLLARDHVRRPVQAARELGSALDHDLEAAARRVRVPATVVRGDQDRIAPRTWLHELASWLPQARVVDLPLGAHAVHTSHPHLVAAALEP